MTVTSPRDVCVTPDTNRPGGIESIPRSSTLLPRFPRPEHDLTPAFFDRVSAVGPRTDGAPILRQQHVVGFGEADDVGGMLIDAT